MGEDFGELSRAAPPESRDVVLLEGSVVAARRCTQEKAHPISFTRKISPKR